RGGLHRERSRPAHVRRGVHEHDAELPVGHARGGPVVEGGPPEQGGEHGAHVVDARRLLYALGLEREHQRQAVGQDVLLAAVGEGLAGAGALVDLLTEERVEVRSVDGRGRVVVVGARGRCAHGVPGAVVGHPLRRIVAARGALSWFPRPCARGGTGASHTTHAAWLLGRHRRGLWESIPRRFVHVISTYA